MRCGEATAAAALLVTGPAMCAATIPAPSMTVLSKLNASTKVTHGPPKSAPLSPDKPSSVETSATAAAAAIARVVQPITPVIPGSPAARPAGPPGCSHANQPEQIGPANAGTTRYTTKPRSFSAGAPRVGSGLGAAMDGVSRTSRKM